MAISIQNILSYTTNFISPNAFSTTSSGQLSNILGLPENIVSQLNKNYLVTIRERFYSTTTTQGSAPAPISIRAALQSKFKLTTGSNWATIGHMFGGVEAVVEDFFQFGTRHSLRSKLGSRRKWEGSDPVSITLELKFEAFSSPLHEVIAPCAALQAMCLPREGTYTKGFFLIPPGPDPFKSSIFPFKAMNSGDNITIEIGDFLRFDSVIVKEVDVEFETRMGIEGPVGAKVNITFETYEILTRSGLEDAYRGRVNVRGPAENLKYDPLNPTPPSALGNQSGSGVLSATSSLGGAFNSATKNLPTVATNIVASGANLPATLGQIAANEAIALTKGVLGKNSPQIPSAVTKLALNLNNFNPVAFGKQIGQTAFATKLGF